MKKKLQSKESLLNNEQKIGTLLILIIAILLISKAIKMGDFPFTF